MTATSGVTAYRCCNDERLAAVRARTGLNGIEAVELVVPAGPLTALPSRLDVVFVKPVEDVPTPDQLRVSGGSTGQGLTVVSAAPTHDPRVIRVDLASPGDLTEHELRLVDPVDPTVPPAGIDPVLARCRFSFAVVCQTEDDCGQPPTCPPSELPPLRIDRLARDYPGLRRLLLDRLSLTLPEWRQRNPADVRTALVELLAYVADQVSYQQDAVTTEAYLGTARSRVSVRRHARLVDYHMHDGVSARAFVQLVVGDVPDVSDGRNKAARGTFLTAPGDKTGPFDASTPSGRREVSIRRRGGQRVFHVVETADPADTVAPAVFSRAHNQMQFHTWSGDECCLPAGAVRATLAGTFEGLAPGDVLVLAQHRDPQTGEVVDADPTLRHPVRLTAVDAGGAGAPKLDPATDDAITEIAWGPTDALPFTLVVSDDKGNSDAGVALGNIVLVEDGAREPDEELIVPQQRSWRPTVRCRDLAQASPAPTPNTSASVMRQSDPSTATPALTLTIGNQVWHPARDLLDTSNQTLLVAEVDHGGETTLRFGVAEADGTYLHGRPPDAGTGTEVTAVVRCRSGVGPAGNVGAGTIRRVVRTNDPGQDLQPALLADGVIESVTNPLPAWGGRAPETIEHVQQRAPFAFNVPERAVTAADYAHRAEQYRDSTGGGVQRAVAQLRWTGAWYTVFVAVDRDGGAPVDDDFERGLREYLDRYRMAGHDVEVEGAVDVPLEVSLQVRLHRETLRATVMDLLTDRLSNRRLSNGTLGLFHPDRLTFAQTVYLSPIVAEAQRVPGVAGVEVLRFGPYRRPTIELRDLGLLEVGRNEIARLDNDPSRPDRGVLDIALIGGR